MDKKIKIDKKILLELKNKMIDKQIDKKYLITTYLNKFNPYGLPILINFSFLVIKNSFITFIFILDIKFIKESVFLIVLLRYLDFFEIK